MWIISKHLFKENDHQFSGGKCFILQRRNLSLGEDQGRSVAQYNVSSKTITLCRRIAEQV